ncbi:MAG: 3-hydroxyacyl-ACP dehydratase FabZ family protein [Planctomycetota bacterium]
MPQFLFDVSTLDKAKPVLTAADIERINPHRHEFRLIESVLHIDTKAQLAVGYWPARDNQFWVRGHIPGRPLFPGVLQMEAAAQLCSVLAFQCGITDDKNFFGFVGLEDVKFRRQIVPGDDIYFIAKVLEARRVVSFETQGVVNGTLAVCGKVLGSKL